MSEDKVHDLFPASCRLAIGSTDVKGTNTIEQWKATLDRYAKSSFGLYAKVIQAMKIDEEFVTYYKPSADERASANEDKFAEKILTCTVESRMKLVEDFKMIRPKMTSYVMQSITEAGEKTLKERYRLEWQKAINEDDVTGMIELIIKCHTTSGKASSYADKRRAEEKYRNHLYIEGTTIAAYSHQLYLLDREVAQVGGTPLDEKAKVYKVLASLTQHSNISIKSKVIEYLTSMEKEEFPASRDEVLEELLTIETITNMCYNGAEGKKKSDLTPSVNATAIEEPDRRVAPVMITLKDGSQGFQREDGKFDVFQFSSNGKFSGMKTVTGQLQVPNVKREDTKTSIEGSSATEKHLKTLMKTHQCSRAEALKKIKCYKCQKRGHFAKDCNEDAEDEDDDSDEDISDEEIQKPQAKGKSKKKSHRPYVAHLSYDADTSEDDENPTEYRAYQAVYRPRSCFDPPAPSQSVKNPVPQRRNKVKYKL